MTFHWHAFLTAVQFLTRVPVPGGMSRPGADPALLRAAVVFFPVVGGLVGAVTGGVVLLAGGLWPVWVAVALALIAEALLTGAFHEDAVADVCDAFGGGWTADDVLRILKDSRVGSFGALGLGLAVGLRAGCLAGIPPGQVVAAAAAAGALGRAAILLLMLNVPPLPHRGGLAKDVGEQIGPKEAQAGWLLTLPGAAGYALLDPWRLLAGLFAMTAVVVVWGWRVRRRIGGVTGDCLGAGCYFAQLAVLLAASAGPHR